MKRPRGSIISRGPPTWLVRVYSGEVDGKRKYRHQTIHGRRSAAAKALQTMLGARNATARIYAHYGGWRLRWTERGQRRSATFATRDEAEIAAGCIALDADLGALRNRVGVPR